MYYFSSVQALKEEIVKRREKRWLIQSLLDAHVLEKFGIKEFSNLVASGILGSANTNGKADPDTSYGVLARQIPGICTEDVACHMLSTRLGIKPLTLAFSRDTFHAGSNDKLFRVKIPFNSWSKKGNLQVNFKPVVTNMNGHSFTDYNMIRMDRLKVGEQPLHEYHRSMQQSVFSHSSVPCLWGDVSLMWGEILLQTHVAGKAPKIVWRNDENGRDHLCERGYNPEEARNLVVRPSSKWYYGLYLSMFLDGRFVLLETYDNETGGVPEARRLFEKEMNEVYAATGFMPLVVKTYPLRPDMLYVNQHIIDNPTKAFEIFSQAKYWLDDTVSMTRWLADRVIEFRG